MPRRKSRRWTGLLKDFFPPSSSASAAVLGLMVRYDEIRIQAARLHELSTRTSDDASIETSMLVRQASVSSWDAYKLAQAVLSDPATKSALEGDAELWPLWSAANKSASDAHEKITCMRNHISAHLDLKRLRKVVVQGGEMVEGSIVIGDIYGELRFPIAHVALSLAVDKRDVLDEDSYGRIFAEHVAACRDGSVAILKMVSYVLMAYLEVHKWYEHATEVE